MKIFRKCVAVFLAAALVMCSFSGCALSDDTPSSDSNSSNGNQEKGLLDDLFDVLLDDSDSSSDDDYDSFGQGNSNNSSSDDSLLGSLFDAFFGGSSSDYGWGDSSYSSGGNHSNQSFEYADISSIPSGNGKATIMVYIIGSNLETDSGCATMDIQEMCEAKIGDNVNLIIEAGGAKKWQNSVIDSGKVGRYKVVGEGVAKLEDRGRKSMVEPSEVLDFINFCVKNYPSDRYGFIFWDHGGGTMAGFGMDDLFDGDLTLDEFANVFSKSGVKFDFIGFDACLMGTIETAYALADSASYLIAAEEEEPGYGWSYTGWLKALSKNPSLDIPKLGSIIVDDFVAANGREDVTLSVVDSSKIKDVYGKLCEVCSKANEQLYAGNYASVAKARKNTKNYGSGNYEQIDIIDFCNKSGLEGADALASAVKDAVVYHKTNISGTNGLAMYFPYDYPSYYKQINQMLKSFGMNNAKATGFFSNFLSARAGGSCSRAMTPISVKTGYKEEAEEDYSTEDWFNQELASETVAVEFALNEDGLLPLTEVEGGYVYELSDEQKDAIAMLDIGVYVDDGEGYINLGNDTSVFFDVEGNMIIDFGYKWVALDGHVVPFFVMDEGETADGGWYSYGIVQAELTSARTGETRDIDIILYWDNENPDGYIKGYKNSSGEGPSQAERNVVQFVKGDKIHVVCDYYTYDGNYDKQYPYGEELVINEPLKVSYEEVADLPTNVYGHILDIYGNDYYTEMLALSLS